MAEYPLDEWVNWRWEIKWSRYEPGLDGRTGLYSSTDAELTVYINNARRVQWTGKLGECHFCTFYVSKLIQVTKQLGLTSPIDTFTGRNDEGRIPYFKVGIYNPEGSATRKAFLIEWESILVLMMILCHHGSASKT